MKNSFNLHQKQERNKENPEVDPVNCHVCNKKIPGAYGWTDLFKVGVVASCSSRCESVMVELKEKQYA